MAARESQGLQIALILFVMVTVVLAVTTFVFYSSSEAAKKREQAALQQKQTLQDSFNIADFKVQYLLHILGAQPLDAALVEVEAAIAGDATMQEVKTSYEEHMATYGEPVQAGQAPITNYRDLLPNMLMALRGKNTSTTALSAQVNDLNNEKLKITADEKKRTDLAVEGQKAAEDQRADERVAFNTERDRITKEREDEFARFKKERQVYVTQIDQSKKQVVETQADVKKLESVVTDQRQRIEELRDEPFEVPDGEVIWVNQGARSVWINLGLADGLRRQTLFSVYDLEDNGVTRAERKASIEITKVLDEHLSEARIVSDDPGNPILRGDLVFSPAWRPGRRVRFALAGFMDIDGDGRSDRQLLRNLLTSSGAEIDAEVHDDGTVEGEITASTRYMVRGERPTDKSDSTLLAAFGSMTQKAQQLGVETITVDKLLSWMGYKPEVRTVGLGKSADPLQFKARPDEGKARTSTGNVSDKFRDRRPPATKGSAYRGSE